MIYNLLKGVITSVNYDKIDITNKLDVFLLFNRITEEQYQELLGAVNDDTTTEIPTV